MVSRCGYASFSHARLSNNLSLASSKESPLPTCCSSFYLPTWLGRVFTLRRTVSATFPSRRLTELTKTVVKLAHYLKIPSITLFFAQGLATILGALTQVGVTLWMLGNVDGICTDDQPNGFTCPNGETVYSSSIIWGLIGPARLYSVGNIYSGLVRTLSRWCSALPTKPHQAYRVANRDLTPTATLLLDWTHPPTDYLLYLQVHQVRLCAQDQLAPYLCWDV